jgi:hypothetical protein
VWTFLLLFEAIRVYIPVKLPMSRTKLDFLANSENISLDEDSQNLRFSRHIMFKSSYATDLYKNE